MPTRRTSELHAYRWSATHVRYFVTCCTHDRKTNLTAPDLIRALHTAIRGSDLLGDTSTIAFTAMPDHLHWLFQLGDRLSLGRVIARFKSQTKPSLSAHDLRWQRDFFEHRVRAEEIVEDYARYIFLNPYRARLADAAPWPAWWCANPVALEFLTTLDVSGAPPREWLKQEPPHPLATGE